MTIPTYDQFIEPLLRHLATRAEGATTSDAYTALADLVGLSPQERTELLPSRQQPVYQNRIGWAFDRLKRAGFATSTKRGVWAVTAEGAQFATAHPSPLSGDEVKQIALLEPGKDEAEDADAHDRIRRKLEQALPDEATRTAALQLLAHAIENADDERADAWLLKETWNGLQLFTGRLLACSITRRRIQLSVMGPVDQDVRSVLQVDAEDDEAWKWVPGGVLLTFPPERAADALGLLKDAFDKFVDEAMARVRRSVSLEDHRTEAVAYVSAVVGRELPQPTETSAVADEDDDADGEQPASREPIVRGRSPIFGHSQRSIASLIEDIEQKTLALPDLQRPFVWEDTKVRDLLDSLFVGFPVGTLVLWHTSDGKDARAFGGAADALKATALVIDGQQRLTSLYAVLRGVEVSNSDGSRRRISIAFRPRDGRFEVADAAIRNNPEYLPNVTELWSRTRTKNQIRKELFKTLREKGRDVDETYENAASENLDRAHAIADYLFPVVDIRKSAANDETAEEDVAEIFVRINSQGTRLRQADFVLTLLSVFHGPLRDRIENRATEMSSHSVVTVDTQQLLRATCAVGFGRAKMSAIYRYLRGVDPVSGDTNVAARQTRLEILDRAATECIDTTMWRDYVLRLAHAGVVNQALVASNNAIVNAYAFYVLGRRVGIEKPTLDALISRWLFGTLLSARYSGSSETAFEQDLSRVRELGEAPREAFVRALDDALNETISGDYWTHTVVAALETQKARAPTALAFRAAQVVLGARALFSDQLLQNLLAPATQGKRAASETHHVFPRAWLARRGIRDRRRINQVANLADVGWYENSLIAADGPAEYVPRLREKLHLDDDRWGRACAEHALPPNWHSMEYDHFLRERRQRMAEIIRVAYRKLGGEPDAAPVTPPWFLPGAEHVWMQIVATERALRGLVRQTYSSRFGDGAAKRIEEAIPEKERESLARALRARPAGADPLTVVDYLYLAQLPPLVFLNEVWQDARAKLGGAGDAKQRLQLAIQQIAPVRNEIAHVREVDPDRLQRASVACKEVLAMLGS